MIQIKHKVAYYAFNFMSGRHYTLVTDFSKTSEHTTKKKRKKSTNLPRFFISIGGDK